MRPTGPLLVLAVLILRLTGSASAETFTGRVIGVTDGDTITVLRVSRPEVIRLRGIDAPERGQAYGERARQYTATLVFGKVVAVEAAGRDRYGRLLAEVRLPDGRSLSRELVRAGLAWWFQRYSRDPVLAALEGGSPGRPPEPLGGPIPRPTLGVPADGGSPPCPGRWTRTGRSPSARAAPSPGRSDK
jgi:micrococcal nuclease